ncbi:MAG: type II secretion system protein GspE [Calditrichaeota bacterium]|nr:MAG: type II secretion system protein GspE [Calditrichota bacterium]
MLKQNDEKLGDILIDHGYITFEDLEKAFQEHNSTKEDLAALILRRGYAQTEDVLRCVAEQLEIPYLELEDYEIEKEATAYLPKEMAYQFRVIPIFKIGNVLTVAMSNAADVAVTDTLRRTTKLEIEPAISPAEDIKNALIEIYGPSEVIDTSYDEVIEKIQAEQPQHDEEKNTESLKQAAEDAPVIKLVNLIIGQAISNGASDIHISPEEDKLMVRYRIDGILREAFTPPKNLQAAIISRLKILSEMDIAETRVPQDGRCQASFNGNVVDLRVSTLPTVYGENIVCRILDKSSLMINLEELGFGEENLANLKNALSSSYGILLVTGPTGSGKTTTLYSCLNKINTPDKNIITIEDPVEYRLPLIRQAQVNTKAKMTFAAGLRSILRQDPDIVMVGEIRDSETAKIAVEAALTGHLVLSTLHTNDAPGAVTRLIEMGVEPFLVASATIGVLAQRLVRKICPKCKYAYTPTTDLLNELGFNPAKRNWVFYKGKGCKQCNNMGYKGRMGIYEILLFNEEVRTLCLQSATSDEIKKASIRNGMRTLRQDGFVKVLKGITTIEEVMRATNVDT